MRAPEEDDLSEECVCEPPRACLCCHCPPEMVERDLLYAYQGLKDSTKGEESVEDRLPTSITQGASNLRSDEDMDDKIKLLDPRVQTLIRTYLEVIGELPPPASCDKLVQMDLKLKPEFVGHKIRRRPYPPPKEQGDEIERQIQECIDAGLVMEYKDRDYPQHCSPCFLVAKPGSTAIRSGGISIHHPSGEGVQVKGHAVWRGQRTRSVPRADEQDHVHPTTKT